MKSAECGLFLYDGKHEEAQMMKIYLIRHGQTAMNKSMALQGRSDLPLNDAGIHQAQEAGEKFAEMGIAFDRVYSSPLIRAVQTAEYAGESDNIILDERLIEMDYGPYEGMDLRNPPEEVRLFFSDFVHRPAPEGMEQLADVTARLGDFLEEIKSGEKENVLISTHAIAMKGALEYLTPESHGSWWSKHLGNCEVYVCSTDGRCFSRPEKLF